jgi:hypothetical protein
VRRLRLGFGILVALGMAPSMFADITDYMLNINGTTYCPSGTIDVCSNPGGFAAAPGVASNLDVSFDGTGLGSVSFTYNPGPGTFNVNLWLFEQLSGSLGGPSGPPYNEFGQVSAASPFSDATHTQTYEIDVPDYEAFPGDPNTSAVGNIIANTAASTLDDGNHVPGNLDCTDPLSTPDPSCNDFTSMALGLNFTLGLDEKELITFKVSTTPPPSGFYLEQTHPANDPNGTGNTPEIDYYFTGSATTESIVTGAVPEPGSILLLATLAGILLWAFRSRSAAVKAKS